MMPKRTDVLVGLVLGSFAAAAAGQEAAPVPMGVDPKADAILRRMSEHLAAATRFQFEALEMVDELLDTGQKIQFSGTRRLSVRRPDKVLAEIAGDTIDERVCYDGKTLTLLDRRAKAYGTIEAPDTIDEALDFVAAYFGVTLPLSDLLFSDPYRAVIGQVRQGYYVGLHAVENVKCHHLAFRQDALDWQVWIEDGDRPLPRKLVITYKALPGQPQYIALLGKWDLSPDLPDSVFVPDVPEGTKKIDLKPGPGRPGTGRRPAEKAVPKPDPDE
jgi:hypothetical protein